MKIWSLYSLAIGVAVMSACADDSPNSDLPPVSSLVFGENSTGDIFRKHHVGDIPDDVRQDEWARVVFDSDTLMEYTDSIHSAQGHLNLSLFYSFDVYGLFEIQADLYTTDSTETLGVIEDLKDNLNERFGEHSRIGPVYRWTTSSPSNNTVEISLSQELDMDDREFVSLNFLEPLEDEI